MANISLYSDENFALGMVSILRELEYTVITCHDVGQANQNIPDDKVLEYATLKNFTVITFNRSDFIKLHQSGLEHAGIIICKEVPKRVHQDYRGQIEKLHEYLQNQASLNNRLILLKKQQKKGSVRQIFLVEEYLR
jgi:predicted nuclease of predicted toxin-antitoxin system